MFCTYAMLISGTVTLYNAFNSQTNRQYLVVLDFYCNQSQYDVLTCKKQTRTFSCFIINRSMIAFRGLASDRNKTGKRNSNSVIVSNWNTLHLSHLLTRRVQKFFYIFPEHTTLPGFSFYGDLINPSVPCFHHLSKLCCKFYLAKHCSALFDLWEIDFPIIILQVFRKEFPPKFAHAGLRTFLTYCVNRLQPEAGTYFQLSLEETHVICTLYFQEMLVFFKSFNILHQRQ